MLVSTKHQHDLLQFWSAFLWWLVMSIFSSSQKYFLTEGQNIPIMKGNTTVLPLVTKFPYFYSMPIDFFHVLNLWQILSTSNDEKEKYQGKRCFGHLGAFRAQPSSPRDTLTEQYNWEIENTAQQHPMSLNLVTQESTRTCKSKKESKDRLPLGQNTIPQTWTGKK